MTPALLARAGALLFGPEFRRPLAAALGVDVRVVRRWCAGSQPMPPGLPGEVAKLVADRRWELRAVGDEIRLPG